MSRFLVMVALLLLSVAAILISSEDTVALGEPVVSIESPAEGSIHRRADVVVTGAAWNATQVQVRLAGGDWMNATWQNGTGTGAAWRAVLLIGHSPNGALTIEARAWNGSMESLSAIRTLVVDLQFVVNILQPPQDLLLSYPVGRPILVTGRILLPGTSVPAVGVDVRVHSNGALVGQAMTDSNGYFETVVDLSAYGPGDHNLVVTTEPSRSDPESTAIQLHRSTHDDPMSPILWVVPLVLAIAGASVVGVYLVLRRRT